MKKKNKKNSYVHPLPSTRKVTERALSLLRTKLGAAAITCASATVEREDRESDEFFDLFVNG
jgi:hypothetical protein